MTIPARFETHTVQVATVTRTSDGQGGWTESLGAPVTFVGSLQPRSDAEGEAGDQERSKVAWVFFHSDPDAAIRRDDTLTSENDGTFLVLTTVAHRGGGTRDYRSCELEQIQAGS